MSEDAWDAALVEYAAAIEARADLDRCGHPVMLRDRVAAERRVEAAREVLDALALAPREAGHG